jgi:rsbT co-antagonist protein RsbR
MTESQLPSVLQESRDEILSDWIRELTAPGAIRERLVKEDELKSHCKEFLDLLIEATKDGKFTSDVSTTNFTGIKEMLSRLSRFRSEQGFTPVETATFVFSLKRPVFAHLRKRFQADPGALFQEIWAATELLDKLGLYTTDVHQKSREAVILRQQADMLELSTPVVKLWDGVLALPLIGTLDSNRTQVVMESLLQRIVDTNSEVAIIDITGVPTVDTLVAQHLMKTVAAARLMGVECIISGVRPQIAQTIVHLGVALGQIPTKSTLASAFKMALRIVGSSIDSKTKSDDRGSRLARDSQTTD